MGKHCAINGQMRALSNGRDRGMSFLELLLALTIIVILAAIAISTVRSALRRAREGAAAASIRTVTAAQLAYANSYGSFADELRKLGPSTVGRPSADAGGFLESTLGCSRQPCRHQSYEFFIIAGRQRFSHHHIVVAVPVAGNTGRSLCSSESSSVYIGDDSSPISCLRVMFRSAGHCVDDRFAGCRGAAGYSDDR